MDEKDATPNKSNDDAETSKSSDENVNKQASCHCEIQQKKLCDYIFDPQTHFLLEFFMWFDENRHFYIENLCKTLDFFCDLCRHIVLSYFLLV